MPTPLFQAVISGVVDSGLLRIGMPPVAVALDIDVAIGAEEGEIETIELLWRSLEPLTLGIDSFLLESSPKTIFQRASMM
jgi:hypothetical protein